MALQVDPWMKSVRIPAGHQLDFGGIVKSWTAHQLAIQLRKDWQVGRGFINAGGDVEVWGGRRRMSHGALVLQIPMNRILPRSYASTKNWRCSYFQYTA